MSEELAAKGSSGSATPGWRALADNVPPVALPRAFQWRKALPFIGPIALFIVWDLVVRFGLIKAILLPTPADTLYALVTGLAGGPLLGDFAVTVMRTLEAF